MTPGTDHAVTRITRVTQTPREGGSNSDAETQSLCGGAGCPTLDLAERYGAVIIGGIGLEKRAPLWNAKTARRSAALSSERSCFWRPQLYA